MKDVLQNLIDLQEIDSKLQALEALKGDLPQQVNHLRSELDGVQSNLDNLKTELTDIKKSKMHCEGEVKSYQAKLEKYQNQLYAVTSNKEYDAITHEMDMAKEKIDEWETVILESLETEESLSSQIEDLESKVQAIQEDLKEREKDLQERVRETEKDTAALKDERKKVVQHINKPILNQYERIRRGKGGVAVVPLEKYACGGCYTAIPPQRAMEIRSMDKLIICESCGRILVYKNQKHGVTTA